MIETPSADCTGTPGRVVPVIDRNRCEAKADCVRVCPYGVFSIQTLRPEDRTGLSLRGRLKAFFHGGKQAYTPKADQCHACGLCVSACPEKAIDREMVPGRHHRLAAEDLTEDMRHAHRQGRGTTGAGDDGFFLYISRSLLQFDG